MEKEQGKSRKLAAEMGGWVYLRDDCGMDSVCVSLTSFTCVAQFVRFTYGNSSVQRSFWSKLHCEFCHETPIALIVRVFLYSCERFVLTNAS